jgi:predicted DNA-binding transcriptional regulator YafY
MNTSLPLNLRTSLHPDQLQRLTRLFLIYNLLELNGPQGRLSRRDLEEACNCSPKTIQRDVMSLVDAGAEIRYCRSRRSYVLEKPLPFLEVKLQWPHLLALAMAQESLNEQLGATLSCSARYAFERLGAALPAKLRDELYAVRDVLNVGETRRTYRADILQQVVQSRQQLQTLQITYYSIGRDGDSIRRIDPYNLNLRDGALNLVAYCHLRREVRMFSLDGIRDVQPTGHPYTIPRDFSLSKYLEGAVGGMRGETVLVTVRFDAAIARWAKRLNWEFPHQLTPEADGALLLHGQVGNLDKFCKELLRWGSQVEALEPPTLRQRMLEEAQKIAARYQTAAGGEKNPEKIVDAKNRGQPCDLCTMF